MMSPEQADSPNPGTASAMTNPAPSEVKTAPTEPGAPPLVPTIEAGTTQGESIDENILHAASRGLREFTSSLVDWLSRTAPVPRRAALALVLFLSLAGVSYISQLFEPQAREISPPLASWLLHPAFLPALLCGLYLRQRQPAPGEPASGAAATEDTDRARTEADQRLAGAWLAAILTVSLAVYLNREAQDSPKDLVNEATQSIIACLWICSALAHRKNGGYIGTIITAAVKAMVSIIVLGVVIFATSFMSRMGFQAISTMLSLADSTAIIAQDSVEVLVALQMLILLVGYAWTQRETTEAK